MLSIPRLSPRRLSVMFFQLSILGAIASNVSGSSARRNSKRLFAEHHAGGIAFKQIDMRVRMAPFQGPNA